MPPLKPLTIVLLIAFILGVGARLLWDDYRITGLETRVNLVEASQHWQEEPPSPPCIFDSANADPKPGDYVVVSKIQPGFCHDAGPVAPAEGVTVLGRYHAQ